MKKFPRRLSFAPALPLAAMAASLAVSSVLFTGSPPRMEGRIFIYPLNSGGDTGSERRGIPAGNTLESRIAVFLDELLVGPVKIDLAPTAPKGTVLRHAAVLERTAYIDLSRHMISPDASMPISIAEAAANIRWNIRFNFPRIKNIVITIEGHQVGTPRFQ